MKGAVLAHREILKRFNLTAESAYFSIRAAVYGCTHCRPFRGQEGTEGTVVVTRHRAETVREVSRERTLRR
jgi:hypothetical protein